ncbi:hypothetical protein MalM25_15110 [Planctomycetes bacterium MalM25]|nr:hypothetical protein MalM25_15110 [Planctomycetes bacterium MalM25]
MHLGQSPAMNHRSTDARPRYERRAFSLLELTAVVAIAGVLSAAAVVRWGDYALTTASAQGFARSVAQSLHLAQRQAIGEGSPAAVVLVRDSGVVTALRVVRVTSGGDQVTEAEIAVPNGVTLTGSSDRWEFNYSGALNTPVAGGKIGIGDGDWNWDLTVNALTGHIETVKAK